MKNKVLLLCFSILITACAYGCTAGTETSTPTEPVTEATVAPTQKPTQPPTQAPTEPPTEAPTDAPTEPPEPEIGTFSVVIEQIPTEPPTAPPTTPATLPVASSGDITLIRGSWYLDHYEHANGQSTDPAREIVYTFNTNGTFSVDNGGTISTGTYVFDGTTITYMPDATNEINYFEYDPEYINIIDSDESGMKAVFDRG